MQERESMKCLLYSIGLYIFFGSLLFAAHPFDSSRSTGSMSPQLEAKLKKRRESFDKNSMSPETLESWESKKKELQERIKQREEQEKINREIDENSAVLMDSRPEKYTVESYQAQEKKIKDAVTFLLEKHADSLYKAIIDKKIKNYKDEKGNTVAHRAFEKVSPGIIEFLLQTENDDLLLSKNNQGQYPAELLDISISKDSMFGLYFKDVLRQMYSKFLLTMIPQMYYHKTSEEPKLFEKLRKDFSKKYSFVEKEEVDFKQEDSDAQQKYLEEQELLKTAEIRRLSSQSMIMSEGAESVVDNRPWYQKVVQTFNEMMRVLGETLSVKQAFDILAEEPIENMSSLACLKQEAKITIAIQILTKSMVSDSSVDQKANEFVMKQITTFKDPETGDNLAHRAFKKGSLAMIGFLMNVDQALLFQKNNEGLYPIYCLRLPVNGFPTSEIQQQYQNIVTKIQEVIDSTKLKKPADFINQEALSFLVKQLAEYDIFNQQSQSFKKYVATSNTQDDFDKTQKKSMRSEIFYRVDFFNLFSNESINPLIVASYEERENRAKRIFKFFKNGYKAVFQKESNLEDLVNQMRDAETGDNYAHRACKKASPVLIKFLWDHHKDLFYKKNFKDEYPIHLLPLWRTLFLDEALFKKGFLDDPETVDVDKEHERQYMQQQINKLNDLVIDILSNKDDFSLINSLDQNKNSMFDKAVIDNNESLINFLLKQEEVLISHHQDGWSPLYEAVSNNNLDLVKKMIKKIDPLLVSEQNKKDNGNTPLHKAAINYSFDLLELLIEKLKTMQDFDKKYLLFKNDLGQTCLDIVFHALDQHLKRYIQEKNHSLKQVADLFLNKDQGKETLQELLQAKIENKENVSNGDSVLDLVKNSIGAKSFEFKAFLSQEQIEAIREKYTTLLNSIQSIKSGVK